MDKQILQENIQGVQQTINKNTPSGEMIDLIAVTKYVDSEVIKKLLKNGLNKFGENRPDELLKKQEELQSEAEEIEWHFIGRLQRRPVRKIINHIDYLHSLDRMSLVKEVDKRAENPVKCFLQVNISGEEQKAGFKPEEVVETVKTLKNYSKIKIVGLMTMAPYEETEENLRNYFRELKNLQEEVASLQLPHAPCTELSMGMTDDYPIAIQEGATMIRIGRELYQ